MSPPDIPQALRGAVRPYTAADAAALLEVDRACARAGDGMVLDEDQLPQDAATFDEQLTRQLGSALEPLGAVFVAVDAPAPAGAELCAVGFVTVRLHVPRRLRHVALFGVAVHPDFQRRGHGRQLMLAAIDWATSHGALRLELCVRGDNSRAVSMYRGLGFEVEAVRKDFVRIQPGGVEPHLAPGRREQHLAPERREQPQQFVDDLIMARLLTKP